MVNNEDTILVVDDDRVARTALVRILELEGFEALGFADGAAALGYLADAQAPCLIVLDMRMPVMDGAAFREALLKEPRLAAIPVVVLTAYDASAASELSVLRVFTKPLDIEAFVKLLHENVDSD